VAVPAPRPCCPRSWSRAAPRTRRGCWCGTLTGSALARATA